jgi:hypothetical protein
MRAWSSQVLSGWPECREQAYFENTSSGPQPSRADGGNTYFELNATTQSAALSRFNDSRLAVSRSFSTPRAESGRLVPAGLLAHGSDAAPAFPTSDPPKARGDLVSGIYGASSPLTVAGAASALEQVAPHRVPYSPADQRNQRRPSRRQLNRRAARSQPSPLATPTFAVRGGKNASFKVR